MNKRGSGEEMTLFTVIDYVIIGIVAVIFVLILTNADFISLQTQQYLEKDLSYMASVVHSSPGEITYYYPIKDLYKVKIEENYVDIKRVPKTFMGSYDIYNITIT